MIIITIIIIVALVGADQIIKFWAVNHIADGLPRDLIKFGDFDVLGLRYCENRGAAFSSFSGQRWMLIGLTSLLLIAVAVYLVKMKPKHNLAVISLVMILAGGIGNLIDRFFNGYVVDYLEVRMFNFAIFNFADILVVCGVILYLVFMIFFEGKLEKNKNEVNESGKN